MIVLDEHFLHPRIKEGIERWYQGKVCPITKLRLGTLIPDEAIATLLHRVSDPSFVTLNFGDFWRKMKPEKRFFVSCLHVLQGQQMAVPHILQKLFRLETFRTKKGPHGENRPGWRRRSQLLLDGILGCPEDPLVNLVSPHDDKSNGFKRETF